MTDVFINYRTGDGEMTAALIDQELSRRFGKDRIFRASKSVLPGRAYPKELLDGLRSCAVLLAVIGPDWTNFQARLRDPEDWVRKEIEEMLSREIPIVPVLDGRKTDRLNRADLPDELAQLAELQSIVFGTHDVEAGLKRLGDVVADMVPGLRELDRDAVSPLVPNTVTNSIGDVGGTAVQSRDFTGDVGGTVIKGTHGPVHTGGGDIYQNSHHVSGGRHFSGDGMTYFEGDNHGGVQHRFGESGRREDDNR
ncbi:toll/interleukin-1 receptor domain-containing protein [Streptomyces sp. NBC_00102]|uniref:toll/interleukin-1 receptor domain-containing protein n=1 Tax=Streptomyces sp. NBC_00102 TaxID=2975652 RepID=UPI0022503142|nr:toll/interleukin-1 receptor domain-containing protein [Streptomyces sp. NBC_00102]MCX5402106.1 toll/interleukin-1 receptor domain-containing protein [Streptomyces sp. NBC_00102]